VVAISVHVHHFSPGRAKIPLSLIRMMLADMVEELGIALLPRLAMSKMRGLWQKRFF